MRLIALLPALALAAGCGAAPEVSLEGAGAPAPSPTASFDPATLGERGTWYMTRDGFDEVVGPDRDGMCAWVDRQLAKPEVDGPAARRRQRDPDRRRREAVRRPPDGGG